MRFVEGLTQSQIAERIGVSQMQVSRLLTRALANDAQRTPRATTNSSTAQRLSRASGARSNHSERPVRSSTRCA